MRRKLVDISEINSLVEELKNLRSERAFISTIEDEMLEITVHAVDDLDTKVGKQALLAAIDDRIKSVLKELKKRGINPDA